MKKTFILAALFALLALCGCHKSEDREEVLKVLNWADYIDEDVLANFPEWYRQQTGKNIRVEYETFDINEELLSKIEDEHLDYDAVCPSEYVIEHLLRKNLILPIDTAFGQTPNYLHNVSPYIVKLIDGMSNSGRIAHEYAVPFMWGTCGIMYNKEYVPQKDAQTWTTLWNPAYKDKLLVVDAYRDCYGIALIYAHRKELKEGKCTVNQLLNDFSPQAIATAEKTLRALKTNVKEWAADFNEKVFARYMGQINMVWSGDAAWAMALAAPLGIDLGYEVPKEGSNVWVDGWVIPKYAANPKAASYFINYLCQGYVAVANMKAAKYLSCVANKKVLKDMTDEDAYREGRNLSYFFGWEGRDAHLNPVLYPDSSVLARCALMHDAVEHTAEVHSMWEKLMKDENGKRSNANNGQHDNKWHIGSSLW